MKVNSCVFALCCVLGMGGSALVQAQTNDIIQTNHFHNGRAWQSWTPDMRLGYVVGYSEGAEIGGVQMLAKYRVDQGPKTLNDAMGNFYPFGMTHHEIILAVTRSYQDPLNLRIEIYEAIHLTSMEARGETRTSIDERIRQVRALAAGDAK